MGLPHGSRWPQVPGRGRHEGGGPGGGGRGRPPPSRSRPVPLLCPAGSRGCPWVCLGPLLANVAGPRLECNWTCLWGWPGEREGGWTGPLQGGLCEPGGCAGAWHHRVGEASVPCAGGWDLGGWLAWPGLWGCKRAECTGLAYKSAAWRGTETKVGLQRTFVWKGTTEDGLGFVYPSWELYIFSLGTLLGSGAS